MTTETEKSPRELRELSIAVIEELNRIPDVSIAMCCEKDAVDVIERALRDRDERAAKITEDALPIGADDCDSCERIKRIASRIRGKS